MQCTQCGEINPDHAKFCIECAAPFSKRCVKCGTDNPPRAKFCAQCATSLTGQSSGQGSEASVSVQPVPPPPQPPSSYTPAHLAERIQAEREALEARGVTDGERKSITALFADIKGSTDLIADLDPEDARAILDPTLTLMMDAVHRYEGYVAQSLGDGIFALFGAPIAHEDHPQRALYAALLMQEESRKRAEQLRREKGINVQLRVGINTGEVVLRSIRKDDLHTDYVPVGQSTNLASRMESLATPGSILVSEQTYKLTEGYFEFKALGQAQVKGFAKPLPIYEVAGVGPLRTKLQLSVRRGLARFVGRAHELTLLQQALEQAKAGHGQIAGVMGEPGVGKSRLFHEFKLLSQRGCLVLETFSVSHGKAYPYLPLIDLLRNYFQLANQDDERRRREKITGKVLTLDRGLEDTLPYLFFLLGIAEPTSFLQQMDPQIRRKRILEAIKRLLLRESLNQLLIIIFEDLHWLDAETQAFLQLLSESVATARILLLVNYRPEYQHQWSGKTYFAQLRLDPLGREQAEEMLSVLLNDLGSPLPARERDRVRVAPDALQSLKRFILDKTEGNPFFMEEIVQTLREQGILAPASGVGWVSTHPTTAPLPQTLQLPTTVQGVLSARMDRLPTEEKALLQTLAVIGREFSSSLLRKVVPEREDELLRLLSRLQTAEFVYEQPAFPEVEYIFKHALTQEVAYNSLLIERRKVLHERTAQAIEDVYQHRLDDHYSELAYHYSRSGNTQKAVDYLQLAGQQIGHHAPVEAVPYLTTALEFLKSLPDTPERRRRELLLQMTLGPVLMATKGYTDPAVEGVYLRSRELCQQMGETSQLFPVLQGLFWVSAIGGKFQEARRLGEQLLTAAQLERAPTLLAEAYGLLGLAFYWLGDFLSAKDQLERGIRSYDSQQYHAQELFSLTDAGVICRAYQAWTLWHLGYPDQALRRTAEMQARAAELSHPHSLGFILAGTAWLHQFRREEQATKEQSAALSSFCVEKGFTQLSAWGTHPLGWALGEQGNGEEGITIIRQNIAALLAAKAYVGQTYGLALLAEVQNKLGQIREGLDTLAEALAVMHKTGERFYEAELYRLKGELTLQQENQKSKVESQKSKISSPQPLTPSTQGVVEEAAGYFHKAIEISRKQQAKSLELRATMSLARLWQQQDKHVEAHRMLAEVYGWFTEGFDTKDLQEAKGVLDELATKLPASQEGP